MLTAEGWLTINPLYTQNPWSMTLPRVDQSFRGRAAHGRTPSPSVSRAPIVTLSRAHAVEQCANSLQVKYANEHQDTRATAPRAHNRGRARPHDGHTCQEASRGIDSKRCGSARLWRPLRDRLLVAGRVRARRRDRRGLSDDECWRSRCGQRPWYWLLKSLFSP